VQTRRTRSGPGGKRWDFVNVFVDWRVFAWSVPGSDAVMAVGRATTVSSGRKDRRREGRREGQRHTRIHARTYHQTKRAPHHIIGNRGNQCCCLLPSKTTRIVPMPGRGRAMAGLQTQKRTNFPVRVKFNRYVGERRFSAFRPSHSFFQRRKAT